MKTKRDIVENWLPRYTGIPLEEFQEYILLTNFKAYVEMFAGKYGEQVKVYSVGDFSKEVCGGPHVARTGELGKFRIVKEEASSAGVRRIRAVLE